MLDLSRPLEEEEWEETVTRKKPGTNSRSTRNNQTAQATARTGLPD